MFEGVQELPRTFSLCLRGYDAEEKGSTEIAWHLAEQFAWAICWFISSGWNEEKLTK